MKSKTINPIEIEPETIAEISEEQAEQIEGGGTSCRCTSCTKNSNVTKV
jgi:hypothetical protein